MKHAAMKRLEKRSMSRPSEVRKFKLGQVELVTLGGVIFGKAVFQPGWRWSTCVKPIVNTKSCDMTHLVYHISGKWHVVMDDGTENDFGPGDVAFIPPGHDAWVIGVEPLVILDLVGMKDYALMR